MLRRVVLLTLLVLTVLVPTATAAPRLSIVSFTPAWPRVFYCEGSAWQCDSDNPVLVVDLAADGPTTVRMRLVRWTASGRLLTPSRGDRTQGELILAPGRSTVRLGDFTGGGACNVANGALCPLMGSGLDLLELRPAGGTPRYRWFFVGGTTIPR